MKALHHLWCHILWGRYPAKIVHKPWRMYECQKCGGYFHDQFVER